MFKNRVLRNTFWPEREKVTGDWRKVYNVQLHDLYSSPNIMMIKSRRMRRAEYVALMGENRNAYRVLVRKYEGKRQFARHRRRWEEYIKIHLQEISWEGVDSLIWMSVVGLM